MNKARFLAVRCSARCDCCTILAATEQLRHDTFRYFSIDKCSGLKAVDKVATQVQYVSDEEGRAIGVIVPIELWREIESERETAYLLKSEAMKERLLTAKERTGGITLEEVRAQLGI